MRIETRQQTIYISDDGIEFDNLQDCETHENLNVFKEYIKDTPRLQNLVFVDGSLVDGFFCSSSKIFDACRSWWIENQKRIGRTCVTHGVFIEADYYFYILDFKSSDIINNKYVYNFIPYSKLVLQWELFNKQIPKNPYAVSFLKKIKELTQNNKLKLQEIKSEVNKEEITNLDKALEQISNIVKEVEPMNSKLDNLLE